MKKENQCNNNSKKKDLDIVKIFNTIEKIPLGKISFLTAIYTFMFFLLPYFVYYRFLPIDSSLSSLPIKFMLLGIFGFEYLVNK